MGGNTTLESGLGERERVDGRERENVCVRTRERARGGGGKERGRGSAHGRESKRENV